MRYFFTGKIEKKDNLFCIRIPFNVWEVCKQRDVIQGDLILDNKHIDCELLPEEKGNYKIHLRDEDVAHIDVTQPHKILLHIGSSLIKMDQNSPYSFDNPIRRIDHIDIITQPEDGLCGQTCVAMLAGVTIAEVISVMDCREWQATMGRIISALNYYGIDHSDVIMQRDEYRHRHSRLLLGDPVLDIGSKRRNTSYAFNFLGCICGDRSQDIFGNSQTADRLLDLMVHIIRPPVSQFCGNPRRTVLWIDSISHLCVQVPNLPFCAHNF